MPRRWEKCRPRSVWSGHCASARLSARSARRYSRLRGLFAPALAAIDVIAAQTCTDAERFRGIGVSAERTRVVGNIKFDFSLPSDLSARGREIRARLGEERLERRLGAERSGPAKEVHLTVPHGAR